MAVGQCSIAPPGQPHHHSTPQPFAAASNELRPPILSRQTPQDYLGRLQEFAKLQAVAEGEGAAAAAADLPCSKGTEPDFRPVFKGGALTPARQQLAALGASQREGAGQQVEREEGRSQEQEPKRRRAATGAAAGRAASTEPPSDPVLDSPEPAPKMTAAQRKRRMTTAAAAAPPPVLPSPPPAALQARVARNRRATLAPGAVGGAGPGGRVAAAGLVTPAGAVRGSGDASAAAAPLSAAPSQDRPPWNAAGVAPGTGAGGGRPAAAVAAAAAAAERSDRAAVARLQAQLDSRSEEVAALQQQLKEAEVRGERVQASGVRVCACELFSGEQRCCSKLIFK